MRPTAKLSTSGELFRNFIYLFFGNIGVRAIRFIVTIIIARRIGVDAFGQLNLAQAMIGYFVLISDFGITLTGIREYVKTDKSPTEFAGELIGTRVILAIISFFILIIFVSVTSISQEVLYLFILFSYSIPISALSLEWFYRANEEMGKVAITGVIHIIIPTILLFLFVQNESQILLIPLSFALGGLVQLVIYWFDFVSQYGFPRLNFQPQKIFFFLKLTSLLGLSNIMIQVYYNLDTLLLAFFQNSEVVGLYNAAYRLVLVFTTIAGIVGGTIFPRLSALNDSDADANENRQKIMYLGARILIYATLPVAILGTVYSKHIIQFIYGEAYFLSAPVLAIIIWQIFTVFANVAFAFNLLASSNQRAYFLSVTAGAIINTILNLILIPSYSMIGAAVATIIAEIVVLSLLYYYARQLIAPVPIIGIIFRCVLLTGILVFVANYIDGLLRGIFVSLPIYAVVLYLTRPFQIHEYRYFKLWS